MIYIGKHVPKRYKELPGSIHLGKGIWMFNVELKENEQRI
jgi:hypothetical protein